MVICKRFDNIILGRDKLIFGKFHKWKGFILLNNSQNQYNQYKQFQIVKYMQQQEMMELLKFIIHVIFM